MNAIKQLYELSSIETPSVRYMTLEDRAAGIVVMLDDLSKLARIDGCVAAAWALEIIEALHSKVAELEGQVVTKEGRGDGCMN